MKLRDMRAPLAGMGLLALTGCIFMGTPVDTVTYVNGLNAAIHVKEFVSGKNFTMSPCGSFVYHEVGGVIEEESRIYIVKQLIPPSEIPNYREVFGQDPQGEPGALIFRMPTTGKEVKEADFSVRFTPEMASEHTEQGRRLRNLPCPDM